MDTLNIRERLEKYYGLLAEIDAIKREIDDLAKPISSPNGRTDEGHGSTPGNPTERAAFRRIELIDQLTPLVEEQLNELDQIEHWLTSVEDSEIRAIIRWHYILGLDWSQTNKEIYGRKDYWYCRNRVMRYFKKVEEAEDLK